jgi:uncharacterized protein YaaN involved in tellurite resistance
MENTNGMVPTGTYEQNGIVQANQQVQQNASALPVTEMRKAQEGIIRSMSSQEMTLGLKPLDANDVAKIIEFSKKIDLNETNKLSNFGMKAQSKVGNLETVVAEDTKIGQISENATKLIMDIDKVNNKMRSKNPITRMMSKKLYDNMTSKSFVDEVKGRLEKDRKYTGDALKVNKQNATYLINVHKELQTYIETSLYIQREQNSLPKHEQSPNTWVLVQKTNDLQATSNVVVNMLSKLKVMEDAYIALGNKISTLINTTLPMMRMQLGTMDQLNKMLDLTKAANAVIDTSNAMMVENANKFQKAINDSADLIHKDTVSMDALRESTTTITDTVTGVRERTKERIENMKSNVDEMRQMEKGIVDLMNAPIEVKGVENHNSPMGQINVANLNDDDMAF